MLRPLQQHPHFAACLRAAGREVVETENGVMLLRQFGPLNVGLISRGAASMLEVSAPSGTTILFNAERPTDPALRRAGFWRLRPAVSIAEWQIDQPKADLRRGMRKTWRHALQKAEDHKLKLSFTTLPRVADQWLLQAEAAQSRAKGYRGLPGWIALAWASLHPKDTVLIEARCRGELVAGQLFLCHGGVATYHMAHTTEQGRAMDAHRLMLWRAAMHFVERGVQRLDLGTVDQKAAPGLAQFKLGSGAEARGLGGSWVRVPGLSALPRYFGNPLTQG